MEKISVITPIKNEQSSVKELTERVIKVMNSNYGSNWEFILVNDASTDNSRAIIEKLLRKYKNLVSFNHKKSRGQTGCFKTGFDNATGDIVITMDGDLQVLPESIPRFVEKVKLGDDVVNGIRENRDHPFLIRLASRIYNVLMLIFFNSPVMDNASNFTAFRARYIKNLPLKDNDHRYIIPIMMRRGVKRFGETIIEHKRRSNGKSKYKTLPKYIKGFPEIFFAFSRIRSGRYDFK